MFLKYLKHEWRSVARKIIPLFIAMLATSLLLTLMYILGYKAYEVKDPIGIYSLSIELLNAGLSLLMYASGITVFVLTVRRFYTSFFTDEGYLTFTLPVSMNVHLLGKTVSMMLFTVLGGIVTMLCSLITSYGVSLFLTGGTPFESTLLYLWKDFVYLIKLLFENDNGILVVLALVELVALFISEIQLLFFGISLGSMITKKHRVLSSIGCIIGVNTVSSILQFAITLFYVYFASELGGFGGDPTKIGILILVTLILIEIVKILLFYIGTRAILTKKLNLD